MSKKVDERVVEMQFDNKQFEAGIKTSMRSLDNLKKGLNFDGATKSLDKISSSSKNIDFSAMQKGIETVSSKFTTLGIIGVTALQNITNAAIHAGTNLVKSLTLDPIISGFQEYELQLGSIQTILANTQSKGSTLNDVNVALQELNTYADKTIYNFAEMTRNIGTFTAAGVDLDTAVSSIKGLSNLAAVSGSSSAQAATAMYQLSQAIAAGKIQLMDWNSVVNAGMGGEVFQEALKRTARNFGINVDGMIKKYGSFRESLTQGGWLTTEVLTETLKQLSGAYTEADLIAQGYTEDQAKAIVELANTATSAATEVKTFSGLIDTLREAVGSGWAQTWQLVFGDFEQAKSLFTGISNVLSDMINKSSDARNALLREGMASGWDQLLAEGITNEEHFMETTKAVAKEHGVAIDEMIANSGSFEASLKEGWLTSDMLAESIDKAAQQTQGLSKEQLKSMGYTEEQAKALQELNQQVKDGSVNLDDFAKKMTVTSGRDNLIAGFKNIFTSIMNIIEPVGDAFREVFRFDGQDLYNLTERFRELTESFKVGEKTANNIKRTFKGLFSVFQLLGKVASALIKPIFGVSDGVASLSSLLLEATATVGDFLTKLNGSNSINDAIDTISDSLSRGTEAIGDFISSLSGGSGGLRKTIEQFGNFIVDKLGNAFHALADIVEWVSEHVSLGDVFAGLAGGGIFVVAKKLSGVIDSVKDALDNLFGSENKLEDVKSTFSDMLSSLHDSIDAFSTGIKVTSLVSIAVAIGILTMSLDSLSKLNVPDLTKSLTAVSIMMAELSLSFRSLVKSLDKFNSKGVVKAGLSLIGIAVAIRILSSAIEKLSKLDLDELGRGLAGVGGALAELAAFLKVTDLNKVSVRGATGLIIISAAITILAEAIEDMSELSWDELGRGLAGLAGGLTGLVAAIKVIGNSKIKATTSLAILALAEASKQLAKALKEFSTLSWSEIQRGLTAMGVSLAEVAGAITLLSKVGGGGSLLGSAGVYIAVQSLEDISEYLKKVSKLSWTDIQKGLASMGGALAELTITLGVLSEVGGFSSIFAAGSIYVVTQGLEPISDALASLSQLSWEEVGRGLTAMGGALGELIAAIGILDKVSGFSSLFSSGSIYIVIQGLDEITKALTITSQLSWEEIKIGLVGMGGALAELLVVLGVLGKIAPFGSLLAGGGILLAVQGLDPIASALEQIGSLSWEEIKIGLVGMGGALAEVAIVTGILGSLAPLGGIIGSGSILIGVQGLGDVADALKKFGTMDWDSIKRGLAAMAGALGALALGSVLNTLSLLGSMSIAQVAEPLGVLADSINKWKNVTIPEGLPSQLGQLARGLLSFTFGGLGAGALAKAAPGIGEMAGSVSKWKGVTIPDGLEAGLKSISSGVKSFTWAFVGGFSIDTINKPLGSLAGVVKKWNGVTIPEGIKTGLKGLADGVKSFTWAFVGGWSIGTINEPLANLASAVRKWNGIVIPEGIGSGLNDLAKGIKSFAGIEMTSEQFSGYGSGLRSLGQSALALQNINYGVIGSGLTTLSNSIKRIPGEISTAASGMRNAVSSMSAAVRSQIGSLSSAFSSMITSSLNVVRRSAPQFSNAARSVTISFFNTFVSTINSRKATVTNAMKTLFNNMINDSMNVLNRSKSKFQNAGRNMIQTFINGVNSKKTSAKSAVRSVISGAASAASTNTHGFYVTGQNLINGLIRGINSRRSGAISAAASVASAALAAAKNRLKVHSPSRAFYEIGQYVDQGLINGLKSMKNQVMDNAGSIGEAVLYGAQLSLNSLPGILSSDISVSPRITPVVDLTNVRSSSLAMSRMFGSQTLHANADVQTVAAASRMLSGGTVNANTDFSSLNKHLQSLEQTLTDYISATRSEPFVIENNINMNGRTVAKTIAPYMPEEIERVNKAGLRKGGKR